jgi:acetoacetyl-CoA reductase
MGYKSTGKGICRERYYSITANAIAPGFVDTDMVKSVPDEAMKSIISKIPLGRLGKAS